MIVCYAEGMKDPKFRAGYLYALKQAGKLEEYIEAQYQEAEVLRGIIDEKEARLMRWSEDMSVIVASAPCTCCGRVFPITVALDYFNKDYHFCSETCEEDHLEDQ